MHVPDTQRVQVLEEAELTQSEGDEHGELQETIDFFVSNVSQTRKSSGWSTGIDANIL